MYNAYRAIVRTLATSVLLIASANAIAQTGTPVYAYRFQSPQACALHLIDPYPTSDPVRLLAVEPGAACRNGQAQGVWIFGTEWAAPAESDLKKHAVRVHAAAFDAGSSKWMSILFYRNSAFIRQMDAYGTSLPPMRHEHVDVGISASLRELQARFDKIAAFSGIPPAERSALLAVAQRWLSDPDSFFERYTADTGMAFVQPEKIFIADPVHKAALRQQMEERRGYERRKAEQMAEMDDAIQAMADVLAGKPRVSSSSAAPAAQQVTGSDDPKVGKSSTGTTGSSTSSAGGISCAEAVRRLHRAAEGAGDERRFLDSATGDQVQEQILWVTHWYNQAVNRVPQCANDAAYRKRFDDDLAATRQNCPGRVQGSANCTNGVNRYLDVGQLDAALQQLMAGGRAPGASSAAAGDASETACAAKLQSIQTTFNSETSRIPSNSVVVRSEALMWMLNESRQAIRSTCPGSDRYRRQEAQFLETYGQTRVVCDKSTSGGPCQPRLPGAQQTARPQAAQTANPPITPSKPPSSCESTSGANWLKCQRESCDRMSGVLESKGSCVSCNGPGGGFNSCPPGAGFNSVR